MKQTGSPQGPVDLASLKSVMTRVCCNDPSMPTTKVLQHLNARAQGIIEQGPRGRVLLQSQQSIFLICASKLRCPFRRGDGARACKAGRPVPRFVPKK